jgi:hypothetical protein
MLSWFAGSSRVHDFGVEGFAVRLGDFGARWNWSCQKHFCARQRELSPGMRSANAYVGGDDLTTPLDFAQCFKIPAAEAAGGDACDVMQQIHRDNRRRP